MSYKCHICEGTGIAPNMPHHDNMCWTWLGSGEVSERRPSPRYERRVASPVRVEHKLVPKDPMATVAISLNCFVDEQGFVRVQQRTIGGLRQRQEDMK